MVPRKPLRQHRLHASFWSMAQRVKFSMMVALSLGMLSKSAALYATSPPDEPPLYCSVFNHMVKSGGSSIKDQIIRSSRIEGQDRPGICTSDGHTLVSNCVDALYNSPVVLGYGELLRISFARINRECEFFTMMRHPIDRLVSAYVKVASGTRVTTIEGQVILRSSALLLPPHGVPRLFSHVHDDVFYCPTDHDIQRKPEKWCGDAEVNEPATERLLDFAKNKWKNKAFQQMLYSFVCPQFLRELCRDDPQIRRVPKADLTTKEGREAMSLVQARLMVSDSKDVPGPDNQERLKTYVAVGIAEHWELSMALFDARVRTPVRHWNSSLVANAGGDSSRREELLEWAYLSPEIHATLAADMLIYEMTLDLFKNQTATHLGVKWT